MFNSDQEVIDLFKNMDFDTYMQIYDGNFKEFVELKLANSNKLLEDKTMNSSVIEKVQIVEEEIKQKKDIDYKTEIALIILEFSTGYKYSKNYKEMTYDERFNELLNYYLDLGKTKEDLVNLIDRFYKSRMK